MIDEHWNSVPREAPRETLSISDCQSVDLQIFVWRNVAWRDCWTRRCTCWTSRAPTRTTSPTGRRSIVLLYAHLFRSYCVLAICTWLTGVPLSHIICQHTSAIECIFFYYSLQKAYGIPNMFPETMNELTIRLAMEPKLFDSFMTYERDCFRVFSAATASVPIQILTSILQNLQCLTCKRLLNFTNSYYYKSATNEPLCRGIACRLAVVCTLRTVILGDDSHCTYWRMELKSANIRVLVWLEIVIWPHDYLCSSFNFDFWALAFTLQSFVNNLFIC